MKRKHRRAGRSDRKLVIQQLESRDLMASHTSNGVKVTYFDQVTDETGKSISIFVDLLAEPDYNVTFTVYSTDTSEGTTPTTSLTFTPANWGAGFLVTVTGKDDPAPGNDDGHKPYGLAFGVMSSWDSNYNGKSISPVPLTNKDDDVQANGGVVNASPIAEDGLQELWLTGHDSDLGGNNSWHIQSSAITAGQGTLLQPPPTGRSVWFEPTPDWYGNVSITYTLVNEWGDTSTAVATCVVYNVPDSPIGRPDPAATCLENSFVEMPNLVGNDWDYDNFPINLPLSTGLTIAFEGSTGGVVMIINNGKGLRFTPFANWNSDINPGAFSVEYRVKDADGLVDQNWVTIPITVTPRNAQPRANPFQLLPPSEPVFQVPEGRHTNFSTQDDGGEGDEYANQVLTYTVTVQPAHGTADPDGFGGWVYTATDPDYNGSDSFQYMVTDDGAAGEASGLTSDPATVSITINPENDQPIAFANSGSTNEDEATPTTIAQAGADGDPMPWENQTLTFELYGNAAHGEVTIDPLTGVASYVPTEQNYNGSDSFWVVVHDDASCGGDALTSQPVEVTITVAPVNDPPEASYPGHYVTPGDSFVIDTSGYNSDIDGDTPLTVIAVTQPEHATVTLNPDGTITADIDADFPFGVYDWWTYTISDGHGGTDTGAALFLIYGSLLASGEPPATGAAPQLNQAALAPIIAEARARWEEAGFETSVLDAVAFQVADLDGLELARAAAGMVLIDRDAAGFGWFVDATPGNDREFRLRNGELVARRDSDAAGRMDLLTAVMHEMGHLLGLDHSSDPQGLMFETLEAGVRRNPDAEAIALALAADPAAVRRRARLEHLFSDQDALDEVLTLFC